MLEKSSLQRQYLRHTINLENLLEGKGYDTKRGKELAEREFNELLRLEKLIYIMDHPLFRSA